MHILRTSEPECNKVAGLQEGSTDGPDISVAIEASIAALYVLASPGLPKQAYPEDTIERVVEVSKFNLMSNVMAFHDARLCQIHRPQLLAGSEGATPLCPLTHARAKQKLIGSVKVWQQH